MRCSRCGHENRTGAKYCEECGAHLASVCGNCGAQLSPTAKFCSECGHPALTAALSTSSSSPRFGAPEAYTPRHLAEKILTSKAALEGERKQVTALFADLKGSMELFAKRDPEEARKLYDPVLEHMMETVHRFEGTVNHVLGDGIVALFGAPPLMALAMVGSACGSPGDGMAAARPHDRVPGLALQPVGFPELRLGGAADQDRLSVVAGVDAMRVPDALGLGLAVAAGERDVDDARGHAPASLIPLPGLGKPLQLAPGASSAARDPSAGRQSICPHSAHTGV